MSALRSDITKWLTDFSMITRTFSRDGGFLSCKSTDRITRQRIDELRVQMDQLSDRADSHKTELLGYAATTQKLFKKIDSDRQELHCYIVALDEYALHGGHSLSTSVEAAVSIRSNQLRQYCSTYQNLANKYEADVNIMLGVGISACNAFIEDIISMFRIMRLGRENRRVAHKRLRECSLILESYLEKIGNIKW